MFFAEAAKYNVLPLDDRFAERLDVTLRPSCFYGRKLVTFCGLFAFTGTIESVTFEIDAAHLLGRVRPGRARCSCATAPGQLILVSKRRADDSQPIGSRCHVVWVMPGTARRSCERSRCA